MTKYDQMDQLLKEHGGYLFSSDITNAGISRTYLAKYVKENHLEKVAKGIYIAEDIWPDDLYIVQVCNPKVIFSRETALYLHGLTDREYSEICVCVPPRFSQTRLRERGIVVHQERDGIYGLGEMKLKTNYGNTVRTYDKERTVCDLIKNRGDFEVQSFQTAMKAFMRDSQKDMSKLMMYAEKLRIRDEVMKYVEVML